MKTLYVDGRRGVDIRLDGPALRVLRPARADGQFPLQRISRIVVLGCVRWQPEAMNACLREHKPVVELDAYGRFVRILFSPPPLQYGLARHIGELLEVRRFCERYERWLRSAEETEMSDALERLGFSCRRQPEVAWQMVCAGQHRRWKMRVGAGYRLLTGLSMAQISSAFSMIGLPRNPYYWGKQEYRIVMDMVRLERWQQAVMLEKVLEGGGWPGSRELIAAFEAESEERGRRIEAWRRCALFAMMGISSVDVWHPVLQKEFLARVREKVVGRVGNLGRIPFGGRETLRSSVRILREYLKYDRRMHESYGAA